jgi:hypothetical protein
MDELNSMEKPLPDSLAPARGANYLVGAVALLILALLVALTVYKLRPPDATGADAPVGSYSSGRALKHIASISRRPHAVGSPEHVAVRNYILGELTALGLQPEVQEQIVVNPVRGDSIRAATVRNVVARLKGTGGVGKALMLVGHYDTVPNAPGASDDGAAVATMLETLRALKSGAPLRNDVIFLFTDAEEVGMLGAKAFTDDHPWAGDVGLVLNFEARGASGPVIMFETSDGNGRLIRELAAAAPHPVANSLSYEIYKLLPNDTDLTVFKRARLPGMNFAFIDSFSRYHTPADNLANIDERSLQHQGEYALALARHLGDADLGQLKQPNSVYFDLLGMTLLRYPMSMIVPLAGLTLALFAAVVVLGIRRRRLTLKGIAAGLSVFVLTLVLDTFVVASIWWLISNVQTWLGRGLQDDYYRGNTYLVGFVLLTVALTSAIYNVFRPRVGAENLTAGALLCWLLLLIPICLYVPGGSYLATWPLLFGLLGLAFMFFTESERPASAAQLAVLSLCAAPGIVLLLPMIYNVFVAMGLGLVWIIAVLVVLACGLLTPYLSLASAWGRWRVPSIAALIAVLLLALAAFNSGFDARHPKTDNLFYVLNADTGQAVWASADSHPDEWTAQFFPANVERRLLPEYLPLSIDGYLKGQAPAVPLPGADIQVTGNSTQGGVRTLSLHVTSPNRSINISVPVDAQVEVLAASVNGKRVENNQPRASGRTPAAWGMQFWAPPDGGFDLTLELRGPQPVPLKVLEQSYGLPQLPGTNYRPRPDYIVASSARYSEMSLVSKSYTF